MSGERYLLDTNAVVALLRGDQSLQQRLQDADWVGISILSEIEFLAFPNISSQDRQALHQFANEVEVVGIETPAKLTGAKTCLVACKCSTSLAYSRIAPV
jgi:tRNA(fMet)-specific endonuclease VapC